MTLVDALEKWEKQLKKEIEEVREYKETEEDYSKGYFSGMEMAYTNDLIRLQGIMNIHKHVKNE